MNLNLSAQRAARDQSEDYCRPQDVLVYRDTPQGIVGTPIVNEGRATQHLTLGQMTPDERKAAVKRAVRKVGAELKANAPAIAKVLQDFDREHAPKITSYTFGRNMRGELVAKTMLPLGDVTHPRRELHIETAKNGQAIECDAVVYERTEDGQGLEHRFALRGDSGGDFRRTLVSIKARATEKAIREVHERGLREANDTLNAARGFYVAQDFRKDRATAEGAPCNAR